MPSDQSAKHEMVPLGVAMLVSFAFVVGLTMWGWLHWDADLRSLGLPHLMIAVLAPIAALMWATAAILIARRAPRPNGCKRATGAALQTHVPFTFVAMQAPLAAGPWLLVMAAASWWTVAECWRCNARLAMIGAPYVLWLVGAALLTLTSDVAQAIA